MPIHGTVKSIRDKHDLKWLRISMSYHRFTNLREILQGDLSGKIMHGIQSLEFMNEPCNCHGNKTGKCEYSDICRHRMIVYENTCSNTGKSYIGNTQQHCKKRMQQHNGKTINQLKEGMKSDSFAKHYSQQMTNFKEFEIKTIHKLLRNSCTGKVLW